MPAEKEKAIGGCRPRLHFLLKLMKTETKHFPVHHVQGRDKLSSAVHHHHSKKSTPPVCHRCGEPHLAPACRFTKAKCHSCGKIGHIAPVCRSKPARNSALSTPRNSSFKNTHTVSAEIESSSIVPADSPSSYTLFHVNSNRSPSAPFTISVTINDSYPPRWNWTLGQQCQ